MTPTTTPLAHRASFLTNLATIAGRSLRAIPREPEYMGPALIVPIFFFVVNVGALKPVAEATGIADFEAFQLPVAIVFAVTGLSRAPALVIDIQRGYFDRLLMTPVRRVTLLLGLMVADVAMFLGLSVVVVLLGVVIFGVSFGTGILGVIVFLVFAAAWGLAFTGFPYAIALKTGNPAAVNSSFLLFFPFAFLTTTFLPEDQLTDWLATVSSLNPVTYLLEGMRSLTTDGWDLGALGGAAASIVGVGAVSFFLAFSALRGRVSRG